MADRVDLDEVLETLIGGQLPPIQVIASMRNELCAWRATHEAGKVSLELMGQRLPNGVAVLGAEAYRATVEHTMAQLGYPQDECSPVGGPAGGEDRG